MAYYDIKRGTLPTTHPYYKKGSTELVNPLCRTSGVDTSYVAPYRDKDDNQYLRNPMAGFLAGADGFFENNDADLLYAGYGLGLEEDLHTYSIGSADETQNITGTLTVQKSSEYGYNVLVNGSVVGGMSKIAPIIYFELVGGGGGGSGSYNPTGYGNGGGGGGGCIRGLIDLSRVSNIYYKVGAGGAGGGEWASGKIGDSSWISVVGDKDQLCANGGGGGIRYDAAKDTGGIGGDGGTCYRSYNGSNITPGGLTNGGYQTGIYVLATAKGGKGGNGARGEGKTATVGQGASISAYSLVGKTIVPSSATSSTSLISPNGIDFSDYGYFIAGGGGGSVTGQGGHPAIAGGTYNGQWDIQDPGVGGFPGGGGGGACCVSGRVDYYTGAKGGNGRLEIKFAYMRTPFWGVIDNDDDGEGSNIGGGDIIINPRPGFEETIK